MSVEELLSYLRGDDKRSVPKDGRIEWDVSQTGPGFPSTSRMGESEKVSLDRCRY